VLSVEELELGLKCAVTPEEELRDDWSWDADIVRCGYSRNLR
jgi:hypothetical protein